MASHDPVYTHGGPLRDGIATSDDPLTHRIIGCAMEVHRALGPGLLETTYEEALCIELRDQGLSIHRQTRVPIYYKGHLIGEHRPDLIVQERVVVEVKSVDRLIGLHQAQLLAYMRLLKMPVGLLLNFNGEVLRTGIRRLVI
ncbi:MAG TPA: GxxExxY protein [Vicinamibacterales bacterium]|nr:GxxExxY protein [Vicinamibacterales bacterium]